MDLVLKLLIILRRVVFVKVVVVLIWLCWVWEWIGGEIMEEERLENFFRSVVIKERKEIKW